MSEDKIYVSTGNRAIAEMKARQRAQQKSDLRAQLPLLIEVLSEDEDALAQLAAALGLERKAPSKTKK